MKFNAIIILLLLFGFDSWAQVARSTSFDDRGICEENKGVWREFGNGCVDECNPKFDQFVICTRAITFGCDCGKGRCWSDKGCVAVTQYQKIFEEKQAEEEKLLQEAKARRKAEYESNAAQITDKLISDAQSRAVPDVAGMIKNNYNEFYQDNVQPVVDNAVNATQGAVDSANQSLKDLNNLPTPPAIGEAPPIVVKNDNAPVPSLFLEQEKAKQQSQAQSSGNSSTQNSSSNQNNSAPVAQALPIIPLPQ